MELGCKRANSAGSQSVACVPYASAHIDCPLTRSQVSVGPSSLCLVEVEGAGEPFRKRLSKQSADKRLIKLSIGNISAHVNQAHARAHWAPVDQRAQLISGPSGSSASSPMPLSNVNIPTFFEKYRGEAPASLRFQIDQFDQLETQAKFRKRTILHN